MRHLSVLFRARRMAYIVSCFLLPESINTQAKKQRNQYWNPLAFKAVTAKNVSLSKSWGRSWKPILPFYNHIFGCLRKYCHISLAVRAFDKLSKLKARANYKLLSDIHSHKVDTKSAFKLPLSLVGYFFSNHYWLYAAVVSHLPPLPKWSP